MRGTWRKSPPGKTSWHWRAAIREVGRERKALRRKIRSLAKLPYALDALALMLGQVDVAINAYKLAELLMPDCEEVRLYQGWLFIATGREEEAWRLLKPAPR